MSVSVDDHPELGASAANRGESAVNLLRSAKQHFLGYVRYMNSTPDNKRKYASVYKDLYGSNNYNQQFLQRLNDHGYDGLTICKKQKSDTESLGQVCTLPLCRCQISPAQR